MFKFLRTRRSKVDGDSATISELTTPYFASHEHQARIADRDRLRAERRQMLCTKHLWRVNRNSTKNQTYPWMIFFVCERCMKDMPMTRREVYELLGVQDIDYRVLITMNTQAFVNEIEQVMTTLRSERK